MLLWDGRELRCDTLCPDSPRWSWSAAASWRTTSHEGIAQSWSLTPATFTTADVRMITQRNRQGSPNPIICTEPSPDVAKALSTAAQLTGSGGNGTTTGSLGAGGASAEAALALAGRSTALLGLRDGLFRACEAYANGVIGADAYALVLSRYGQLMTTLFLGQDVTGAAGTEAGGSVQSPPVSVTVNPSAQRYCHCRPSSEPVSSRRVPGRVDCGKFIRGGSGSNADERRLFEPRLQPRCPSDRVRQLRGSIAGLSW